METQSPDPSMLSGATFLQTQGLLLIVKPIVQLSLNATKAQPEPLPASGVFSPSKPDVHWDAPPASSCPENFLQYKMSITQHPY